MIMIQIINRYSYHQLSVKFLQISILDQWKCSNNASQRNSSNIQFTYILSLLGFFFILII